MAPSERIKIGDTFLNFVSQETAEAYQKGNELINEAIRDLQETTPGITTDESLTLVDNLKCAVYFVKEYASNIKAQPMKEAKTSLLEKILLILQDKCAIAHDRVLQSLKEVKDYDEEAQLLFAYCMQWPDATRGIKDLMDSIESQLADASEVYKVTDDRNYIGWTLIENLQNKFFILQRKKEDAIRHFGQLGDLVMFKHISISSALMDAKILEKVNNIPSTSEEGEDFLVELESLHMSLTRAKGIWDDGKPAWEAIIKEIQRFPQLLNISIFLSFVLDIKGGEREGKRFNVNNVLVSVLYF